LQTFNKQNFTHYCNVVASKDADLKQIVDSYGYPPFWNREPSFETLLHFILEQQVSLASAKAALEKLRSLIGPVTPEHLLSLSDAQLRACYFSRQKTSYARSLATAVADQKLVIEELANLSDEVIRQKLKQIKGIGHWTVDVFLLMSLHHLDVFPLGDVAILNSTRHVKNLDPTAGKVEIATIAETWKPYRSIAAYLLWHAYLSKKGKVKSKKVAASVTLFEW
jgi:DNA-3-methyladenine glycosylase II